MSVQTITIEVDQFTAARLKAEAEAQGVTISDLIGSLTELLNGAASKYFSAAITPEERARAVEGWANQHRSSAPPLSDEAVSRSSIYAEREDKQL